MIIKQKNFRFRDALLRQRYITVALVDANRSNALFGVTATPNDYQEFASHLDTIDVSTLTPIMDPKPEAPCLVHYEGTNIHRGYISLLDENGYNSNNRNADGEELYSIYLIDYGSCYQARKCQIFEIPLAPEFDYIWHTPTFVNICQLRNVHTHRNELVASFIQDLAAFNHDKLIFTIFVHSVDVISSIHLVDLYIYSSNYFCDLGAYINEQLLLRSPEKGNDENGLSDTLLNSLAFHSATFKPYAHNEPVDLKPKVIYNQEAITEHCEHAQASPDFLSDDRIDLIQVSISRAYSLFDFWAIPILNSTRESHREIYDKLYLLNPSGRIDIKSTKEMICYHHKQTQQWRRGHVKSVTQIDNRVEVIMLDFDDQKEYLMRLPLEQVTLNFKEIPNEELTKNRQSIHCIIPNYVDKAMPSKGNFHALEQFLFIFQEQLYILPFQRLETGEFLVNLYGRKEIETGLFELKKYHFVSFPEYARTKQKIHFEPIYRDYQFEQFCDIFRNIDATFLKKTIFYDGDKSHSFLFQRAPNPNCDKFMAVITNVVDRSTYLLVAFRFFQYNEKLATVNEELALRIRQNSLRPFMKPIVTFDPCVVNDTEEDKWYRGEILEIFHDQIRMLNLVSVRLIDFGIVRHYRVENLFDDFILNQIACLASFGIITKRRKTFQAVPNPKELIGKVVVLFWENFPRSNPIDLKIESILGMEEKSTI